MASACALPQRASSAAPGAVRLQRAAGDDDLAEQRVAALADGALASPGGAHRRVRTPGDGCHQRDDREQNVGDGLGDDQDEGEGQDQERQLAEEQRGRTGQRVAHRIHVAEGRRPALRPGPLQGPQRRVGQGRKQPPGDGDVQAERNGLQDPPARLAEDEIEAEHDRHADEQPLQRAHPGVGHDPVVDLEDEHRHGQRQQVDGEGEGGDLEEGAGKRGEEIAQPAARRGGLGHGGRDYTADRVLPQTGKISAPAFLANEPGRAHIELHVTNE